MCVQRAWPSPPPCLACNHASQSHGWAGFRTRPEEQECTLEAYVVSSHGQRVKTLSLDLDALRQNAVDVPIRDTGHCASCLDSLFDPLDPAYAPSVLPNPCLCLYLSLSLHLSPNARCPLPSNRSGRWGRSVQSCYTLSLPRFGKSGTVAEPHWAEGLMGLQH